MKLFSTSHTTMIHLPKGAPESVMLAAQDLRRDLLRLAGRADGFEILTDGAPCGIFVRIGSLAEATAEALLYADEDDLLD